MRLDRSETRSPVCAGITRGWKGHVIVVASGAWQPSAPGTYTCTGAVSHVGLSLCAGRRRSAVRDVLARRSTTPSSSRSLWVAWRRLWNTLAAPRRPKRGRSAAAFARLAPRRAGRLRRDVFSFAPEYAAFRECRVCVCGASHILVLHLIELRPTVKSHSHRDPLGCSRQAAEFERVDIEFLSYLS